MNRILCGLVAALWAGLAMISPAGAATYFPYLTTADFTVSGLISPFGSGEILASPKFSFASGDIVNFGTATVAPHVDGRYQPYEDHFFGSIGFGVYYLTGGVGGLNTGANELGEATGLFSIIRDEVRCETGGPCQFLYDLLFTIPAGRDGVQFAFQVGGLSITPVPVPLPAAGLLFGAVLVGFGIHSRRRLRLALPWGTQASQAPVGRERAVYRGSDAPGRSPTFS